MNPLERLKGIGVETRSGVEPRAKRFANVLPTVGIRLRAMRVVRAVHALEGIRTLNPLLLKPVRLPVAARARVCVLVFLSAGCALGESRTHTGGVLNAVPLPLGYKGREMRKAAPIRDRSRRAAPFPSAVDGQGMATSGSPSRHRHRKQHRRATSRYIFDLLLGFIKVCSAPKTSVPTRPRLGQANIRAHSPGCESRSVPPCGSGAVPSTRRGRVPVAGLRGRLPA
jgi:hypothetical protein